MRYRHAACLLVSFLCAGSVHADEQAYAPPPPPGFGSKRPLAADDLRRKKTGGYFTGLPLANFDPNTGYGGGARGYYFFNGERGDPLFSYTPYQHRVFLQFFATSKGAQFHWLDYDVPALLGSPLRLRSQLIYARNTEQHFFGLGEQAMDRLTFTGAGRSYRDFSSYRDALEQVRDDGTTLSRYNDFDLQRPIWFVSLERTFLRGLVRPLLGLQISYHATTTPVSSSIRITARPSWGRPFCASNVTLARWLAVKAAGITPFALASLSIRATSSPTPTPAYSSTQLST